MSLEKKQYTSKGNIIITVTDLYREIGRIFREYGADKVVLLKSAKQIENSSLSGLGGEEIWRGMSLEVAVDGWIDSRQLEKVCKELWPGLEISVLDLNEDENPGLADEVMEDGILL